MGGGICSFGRVEWGWGLNNPEKKGTERQNMIPVLVILMASCTNVKRKEKGF